MSKDEKVDGPKIAAQILNRLAPAHRERLMKAISTSDPDISQKISVNIVTFDDIADLTSQSVQVLIKEIDHYDLVIALKTASEKVRKAFYSNMSSRKRQVVEEDFSTLPPKKVSEVEEAQRRIIKKLEDLRTTGSIRSAAPNDQLA